MFESEFDRRLAAVRLVEGGETVVGAARAVGRTERWLHKWLRRYEAGDMTGLEDLSRAPRQRPNATSQRVVDKVVETRRRLERSEFGGVGAEAILYELDSEGFTPRPSRATVERILQRAGETRKKPRRDRETERHRPRPKAEGPGMWQQLDWVGPRYLARRVSFSSLHLVDVGGGGAAAGQYENQRLHHAAGFITDRAWPELGIPWSLQVDGAFCLDHPRAKLQPFNGFVRVCLLFGAEVVITPPNELGWAQHVESFNNLWQSRTIRRHRYQDVAEIEASSVRFCHYYNHNRPHPRLQVAIYGTRFPAELVAARRSSLRFPPQGFSITDYQDRQDRLRLPIARGRLTYLRRVQPGGVIELAGAHFFVPASTVGLCVAATILTSTRQLTIRLDGEVIAKHAFPITEKVITPYHPIARRGLFYHITG